MERLEQPRPLCQKAEHNLFLEAQLQHCNGLRSIMNALRADEEFQQAISISSISAAQLSRKNNKLEPEVLQTILCDLITKLHRLQSPRRDN